MKVLIAYDGSDGAKRALEVAVELAPKEAAVSVVAVAEGMPQFGRAAAMVLPEEEEERRRQLAEAGKALAEHGISAALVERRGDAAIAILDEAEKEGVELIVVGTRGLSAIERWLLGSVSSRVLHHARCSVLVVR
jgi:nucleotide-binding universal stress UspA family protein